MDTATTPQVQPVLFIGHGSPMNAIEDNGWSRAWRALGERLPRPRAILCVSAHWTTPGVFLGAAEKPRTIHDFGGFPPALYQVQYPAPGDPELAAQVAAMLDPALAPQLDAGYGLDHGAWQVLLHLFPQADVPVVQLSLDLRRPGPQHFVIGRMLGALRDEGVLILASGNIVHNLGLVNFGNPTPPAWALAFRDNVNSLIAAGDFTALANFEDLPDSRLAIPTPEHYLPLLYALACARPGDALSLFNDDVWSTLSMTSLVIGMDNAA
ncbi:MAG: 4,5-DOPA dioxygenase extradiol [Xanthomonadaceae bacterium]|nr:4,5-DOPA dioxygenase extradiol [Xanthomonadaceae bacterium]